MSLTSRTRRRLRGTGFTTGVVVLLTAAAACSRSGSGSGSGSSAGGVQTITVAVTANPLMTTIENLTAGGFEASHPDIKVKFVTYDENTERADVEKDVAAHGGR